MIQTHSIKIMIQKALRHFQYLWKSLTISLIYKEEHFHIVLIAILNMNYLIRTCFLQNFDLVIKARRVSINFVAAFFQHSFFQLSIRYQSMSAN